MSRSRPQWWIALAMLVAACAALAARPGVRLAELRGPLVLETAVPRSFGEWRVLETGAAPLVAADVRAALAALYTEVLERTYVGPGGERIMLSIAYGRDQGGEGTQVHRPEFCYAAQGFALTDGGTAELPTAQGTLPVRRLVATLGRRHEPITYWVTVGERATRPGLERKLVQLRYGLAGQIPDGVLVRVSSLDRRAGHAFAVQQRFIAALVAGLPPAARARLAGGGVA